MLRISFLISIVTLSVISALGCTSAVISGAASADGRPLLWKNRDTSATDNKVELMTFTDGSYSYVALFNASDRDCREAWIGMNMMGFAVMNTASYNLKDDNVPQSKMDREGEIMSLALRTCTSVDEFEELLDRLPRPLGVEANFGVIDAFGGAAYFETNNSRFTRYDVADSPDGYLVRSNYSHSGRPGEGYGFTREADAVHLLDSAAKAHAVTPELLTETLSRSFYNATLKRDFSTEKGLVVDEGFIPRYKTTATVVVEGCPPVESPEEVTPGMVSREYIMWTALGYPPCAEIVPVWCAPGGVDEGLRGIQRGGTSAFGNKSKALRDKVFHRQGGEKQVYIDMLMLHNDKGTGISQTLRKQNLEVYRLVKSKRNKGKR